MSLNLSNPGRPIQAGVILTKGVTEMIDVSPFELFAWTNPHALRELNIPKELAEKGVEIELHWVTEDGKPAPMRSGMSIQPTNSFANCPALDIVLMGAHDPNYKITEGEKIFIATAYENCTTFITICGGIMAMLEAGLLPGKTVACPRMAFNMLRKNVPSTNWVDKRWARDGKIWSSSSLLNGTDLMRAFALETWGNQGGWIEGLLDAGHWPIRDVDFKDDHGVVYDLSMPV